MKLPIQSNSVSRFYCSQPNQSFVGSSIRPADFYIHYPDAQSCANDQTMSMAAPPFLQQTLIQCCGRRQGFCRRFKPRRRGGGFRVKEGEQCIACNPNKQAEVNNMILQNINKDIVPVF